MPVNPFATSDSPPDRGWTPPPRSPWPGRLLVLTFLAGGFAFLFTPSGQRIGRAASRRLFPQERTADPPVRIVEKIVEKRVEVPVPGPPAALPSGPAPGPRGGDVNALFSGIGLKTALAASPGETATEERASDTSYRIEMTLSVRTPKSATTLEQLRPLNPSLGTLLPELPLLIGKGKVSDFFAHLYDLKTKTIAANLRRLDKLPSRHNFYDLDAMLELQHPATKQKVLLMQADMDVVSDGSDGDRMPSFDDYILKSSFFQPTTSYGWPKTTSKLNPVIPKLEEELRTAREKLKSSKLTKEEKATLTARAGEIPRLVADLKQRSYLIGQEDPFIVIPSSLRNYKGRNEWAPSIGDYAVVVYNNLLLPAVVGDYGPTIKVGEASLRMARQIDPEASPYKRPVSDLKVTYLIFPDSADAVRKAPDYNAWRLRCDELLRNIGGTGPDAVLYQWEDRLAKVTAVPASPATSPAGDPVTAPGIPSPTPAGTQTAPPPSPAAASER